MWYTTLPASAPLRGDATALELHERSRMRAAARHARRLYPGGLGELAYRELVAYADFGYRFAVDALIPRLAAEILTTAVPDERDPSRCGERTNPAFASRPGLPR